MQERSEPSLTNRKSWAFTKPRQTAADSRDQSAQVDVFVYADDKSIKDDNDVYNYTRKYDDEILPANARIVPVFVFYGSVRVTHDAGMLRGCRSHLC